MSFMTYYTYNIQHHDNCKLCMNNVRRPPPLVNIGGTYNMPRFAFSPPKTQMRLVVDQRPMITPMQILRLLEEYIREYDDAVDPEYIRGQLSNAGYNDMRALLKIIHPDKNKGYPRLSQIIITIIRETQ